MKELGVFLVKARLERNGDAAATLRCTLEPATALTDADKATLRAPMLKRGLTPALLDVIHAIPQRTRLLCARAPDGRLLGLCSVLLTPSLFMKHCFGEGNHVGSNNSFFFAEAVDEAAVLTAMLRRLVAERALGVYVGRVDAAVAPAFREALTHVPHLVGSRLLESGAIATVGGADENTLCGRHKHLARQLRRFRHHGGRVEVVEGPLPVSVADELTACCAASYQRHTHPGRAIDIEGYAHHVHAFATSFSAAVHFCARIDCQLVGIQSFVRHPRHLELTEGGFMSTAATHHAYEAIIVESVRYAAAAKLEHVSYGLVNNPAKDRLMDREGRVPIFLVMLFRSRALATLLTPYRYFAHRRLPLPYWRPRRAFAALALEL